MNAREEESLGEIRARAEESLRFPLMVALDGANRNEVLARDVIALTLSVERLLVRVQEAEAAMKRADKIASKAHDAMWSMDFEKTSAGRFEREQWTRLRKYASDEIHKLHSLLRKEKP